MFFFWCYRCRQCFHLACIFWCVVVVVKIITANFHEFLLCRNKRTLMCSLIFPFPLFTVFIWCSCQKEQDSGKYLVTGRRMQKSRLLWCKRGIESRVAVKMIISRQEYDRISLFLIKYWDRAHTALPLCWNPRKQPPVEFWKYSFCNYVSLSLIKL